jgi:hypothetical protein
VNFEKLRAEKKKKGKDTNTSSNGKQGGSEQEYLCKIS